MSLRLFSLVLILGLAASAAAVATPLGVNAGAAVERHVDAEFRSARTAVAPGERFTIVLRQSIEEHWHTYWRNPGDSGEATQISWRLPAGWSAGPIQWPAPEALPFDILVNYGYSGEVLFPIEVTAPAGATVGQTVTLTGDAYWLVCSDICIPEEATLSLTVPIAAQGRDDPVWTPRVAQAVANLPPRFEGDARVSAGDPARLSLALVEADIRNPRFFPYDRDVMRAAEAQHPRVGPNGLSFTLTAGPANNLGRAALEGVVTYETRANNTWMRRAVEVVAAPGAPILGADERAAEISDDYSLAALEGVTPSPQARGLDGAGLLATLALAFLGGLILNIMPCVLPVLSVKALSFADGVQDGQARRHGVLYAAGVTTTFMALATVLVALRGAGEAAGWGFQLQAPWVTAGLALLFFAIGLNLLGAFSITGAENVGVGLAARGGDIGAFFTGALAVVAATPCTAPFMAGAIGVALTQSNVSTFLIFGALALGFAAPLTALSFAPALRRFMPKPGPWMERAKNILAFPMFASAAWLAWVLAEQTGPNGALALLSMTVALGFALLVARWGRPWLAVGLAVLAVTTVLSWRPLIGAPSEVLLQAETWNPARVAELRAEGRGVFVNFTAAWCVTCKVNEATSLSRPRVAQAFAASDIAYLKADWTNRDETIANALAEHGRAGVPLYLYYPPGASEPVVLPQVLSEDLIIRTIEGEPR